MFSRPPSRAVPQRPQRSRARHVTLLISAGLLLGTLSGCTERPETNKNGRAEQKKEAAKPPTPVQTATQGRAALRAAAEKAEGKLATDPAGAVAGPPGAAQQPATTLGKAAPQAPVDAPNTEHKNTPTKQGVPVEADHVDAEHLDKTHDEQTEGVKTDAGAEDVQDAPNFPQRHRPVPTDYPEQPLPAENQKLPGTH